VAVGAHAVPVLSLPCPVQPVAGTHLLISVYGVAQVEPSPPLRIPCDRQALQTSSFERHEVLLQGSISEGVGDFEIFEAAGGAFSVYEVLFALAEEAVHLSPVPELIVVEIAQHAAVGGDVHRQVMVRSLPEVILPFVAFDAGGSAGERGTLLPLLPLFLKCCPYQVDREGNHQHHSGNEADPLPALHTVSAASLFHFPGAHPVFVIIKEHRSAGWIQTSFVSSCCPNRLSPCPPL